MESIQQQISNLTTKVDLIYDVIDRLCHDVSVNVDNSAILAERDRVNGVEAATRRTRNYQTVATSERASISSRKGSDEHNYRTPGYSNDNSYWAISQQDILIDSSGVEITHRQIKEQDLSPQVQIQRLTAQLTAAYNRIAALEELLLANRLK